MNTLRKMGHIIDKPMTNYVHYSLCFIGANLINHKLAKCVCGRCPLTFCKYRKERRQQVIIVQTERRKK